MAEHGTHPHGTTMLTWIIDFSLRHRLLVIAVVATAAAVGAFSLLHLDIDAFPDTAPVQVQINTLAPALSPEEIEQQITWRIEQALGALPSVVSLRSQSQYGLSQVVLTFADGTDIYFARQLISERLASVELPPGIERPRLGPVSTGLGEIFHYLLVCKDGSLDDLPEEERRQRLIELRTLHDWVVRPQLLTVPGVAEVSSWGGYEKQYQILFDPHRLIRHGLTLEDLVQAVQKNIHNVGGGTVQEQSSMILVQAVGRPETLEHIENILITTHAGQPIRVRDVAEVRTGTAVRLGAVTANGRGEAVLGLAFLRMGENAHRVARALRDKLAAIGPTLPPHVDVRIVYDRVELIDYVIETVRSNLFEGGLLVIAVLFAFLGHLRAAAIVALAIPLSMLFAFSGMLRFGIAASLLSLGAIDFGMIVDSSVVLVENCVRQLSHRPEADGPASAAENRTDPVSERLRIIRDAAVEVRKPTLFGELIIIVVYLPILTLEGVEGKLFRPMALTVIFALCGSLVLSMTLMPVLASLLLSRRMSPRMPLLMRLAHLIHAPVLRVCMRYPGTVLALTAGILFVAFVMIAPHLGAEFVPRLSEGTIGINVVRIPGTTLEESVRYNTQMEKLIGQLFPDEVRDVWSRAGTADIATDPMGVELTDVYITLQPRHRWKRARTQEELTELLEKELRVLPGQRLAFTQPIEMRLEEMSSGVRADVVVKLFGDDLDVLRDKARHIEEILRGIPGSADVGVQQRTGQPVLQIRVARERIARSGVPAQSVLDYVETVSGKALGDIFEGQMRFPLVLRLSDSWRRSPTTLGALVVPTPAGEQIPLVRLADLRIAETPSVITREWGQRCLYVSCNVRRRDLVGFVQEVQRALRSHLVLPNARYRWEIAGDYEHYINARYRLMLVVPLAIGLIFTLLYITYGNVLDALRVMTGVPLSWVGGIVALWLRDMPFSISAAIGFIAMSGVSILDDMILVSYIRQLRRGGLPRDEAVRLAAVTRLRPVLMTTLVASLGFLPMAISTGVGAEVQRPLATVVIGGVVAAMLMSLLVIRVLYLVFDKLAEFIARFCERYLHISGRRLYWLLGEYRDRTPESHTATGSTSDPALIALRNLGDSD